MFLVLQGHRFLSVIQTFNHIRCSWDELVFVVVRNVAVRGRRGPGLLAWMDNLSGSAVY